MTVIVPVNGVGRPGSGESVYVTVNGAFGLDDWAFGPGRDRGTVNVSVLALDQLIRVLPAPPCVVEVGLSAVAGEDGQL